jgi:exopolyphosphatase/pppGpp-phosphohydrolase
MRVLSAGLTQNHELSLEAKQTAGQALADYADLLDKFSKRGKARAASTNAIKRTRLKMESAAVKNRERVSKHRAKKSE